MLKCGLIGLGSIGCGFDDKIKNNRIFTHAGAYIKNKKTKLIALCDIDKKKLKKYGKKYHISSLYTDYNDMIEKESIDCISICTLSDTHYKIVKRISDSNVKGIFLEKPISNSLSDAKKIIGICKEKNIKLQIDHQRRFSKFYQKLKYKINEPNFGKIQNAINYTGGKSRFNLRH